MKKYFVTVLFTLLVVFSMAQNSAKVRCKFVLAFSDSCIVKSASYYIDEYDNTYKAFINENECSFTVDLIEPEVVTLLYNNQATQLFLEPGNDLLLNITTDSLYKAITFSGDGSVQNQFLNSFHIKFRNHFDEEAVKNTILNSTADGYEMQLYANRKEQLGFYNSYAEKKSFGITFSKYIENFIRYNYFASLLSYPIINANQSASILTVNHLPEVMLEGIDGSLVNDDALNCKPYRDFLYYYAIYFTSKANGFNKFKDPNLSMEGKVNTAVKSFKGNSLNWYIAWFLNADLYKVSKYTTKHIYNVLSEKENKGVYTKLLKQKVETRLAIKETESTATTKESKTSATSTNSNMPKLKNLDGKEFSIDDLKGKVVYVDFWASWCGPCRQQFPFSKQLHDKFTAKQLKQVVFLYISIDQSEDAWKNTVKQIGMEGMHGISPGNWNSEIAKHFQINSIPRYMLIDKKGNIADGNAKRPSATDELYNDILKLLE